MGGQWWRGGGLRASAADALTHPAVARLATAIDGREAVTANVDPTTRLAAVAAIIRIADEPEVLFIKRAEAERDPWSGHIAFPGGRMEPADASLADTALRETFEELAIDLRFGKLVGRLDDLAPHTRRLPAILVRPFVWTVDADLVLRPSHEVASTFWVPMSALAHPDTRGEHVMTVNGVRARFPAYRVDRHLVWGMTERIVRQLLALAAR